MASTLAVVNEDRGFLIISLTVVLLGLFSFSCCLAAESNKLKANDMKLDGNLCSLPRSRSFGLGIAAIICLFLALITGNSAAGIKLCARRGVNKSEKRNKKLGIFLMVLSWVSFWLAAIMLSAASSMNAGQKYGRGWLNRRCYVVKDGMYVCAAMLSAATIGFVLGFMFSMRSSSRQRRSEPEFIERREHPDQK